MNRAAKIAVATLISVGILGGYLFAEALTRPVDAPVLICIANLREIKRAKAAWADEHNKTNLNATPLESDLFGTPLYLLETPKCLEEGHYSLGKISEEPRCSIPSHNIELLRNVYVSELPHSCPLAKTEPDKAPRFSFAPSKPFRLEFGRGSGRDGFDTIATDETGQTLLYRHRRRGGYDAGFWEKTELKLPKAAIHRISSAIGELRLSEMAREYHADVHDGTQWVFWLQQAGQSKSVYFNNHFPTSIQAFALLLDLELHQAGIANANWRRVPIGEEGNHDKAIWKSLKDTP